jgi:hypothetical protein
MWGGWEVADGVDAPVDGYEATELQPVGDVPGSKTRTKELRSCDDSVLRRRYHRDGTVHRGCGQLW